MRSTPCSLPAVNKAQRAALLAGLVLAVAGLVVGFSPASVDTSAEGGYDCGTAIGEMFGDSEEEWFADDIGAAIRADATGSPLDVKRGASEECPGAISGRRTLTLGAFALAAVVAIGGRLLLKD